MTKGGCNAARVVEHAVQGSNRYLALSQNHDEVLDEGGDGGRDEDGDNGVQVEGEGDGGKGRDDDEECERVQQKHC